MSREWSHPVSFRELPESGARISLEAGEAERAEIAKRLGVEAVHFLRGDLDVKPLRDGARISGRLRAGLARTCVVSLDPMEETIDETFALTLSEGARLQKDGEDFVFADDDVEPLEGDVIDLADLLVQQAAIAMAAYPRKPDARSLAETYGDGGEISPFAALKDVRLDATEEDA